MGIVVIDLAKVRRDMAKVAKRRKRARPPSWWKKPVMPASPASARVWWVRGKEPA